jgi:hypothetical protein
VGLRNTQPVKFSPVGLSDALDGSNVFPGAMTSLQNLIPDTTTKNVWTCRPAAIEVAQLFGSGAFSSAFSSAFSTATGTLTIGFISVIKVVGTRVYGMVATSLNAGHDQPFIYDMVAQVFIGISGITAVNTPVSPLAIGAWTPPTMDLIGTKMIVTHPGYTGAGGNFFGWFDISTFASPTWNAGNTATNALVAVPSYVRQFGQRAYFIVNFPSAPSVTFTDVLDPLTVTNGNQVLTFGDNVPLQALGQLPLNSQLTGGILQALIVFKESVMWQITGDAATPGNPLTINELGVSVGTLCPNAIAPTPKGLAFIANDGVRVIDFSTKVSDPVGFAGNGVTVPFINISVPSRAAMACNADTLRVSLQTTAVSGPVNVEYWFTISRGCWHGPHTCNAALMQPYSNSFVVTLTGINAALWQSDSVQRSTSTFIENGFQLSLVYQTAVLPDLQTMAELNLLETTINIAGSANNTAYTATFTNSDLSQLASAVVSPIAASAVKWGAFTWGQAQWALSTTGLTPVPVNWSVPVVFRKGYFGVSGFSALGFKIGDLFLRYETLGYLQMRVA